MTDLKLLEAAAFAAGLLIGFSQSTHDKGRPYVWTKNNKAGRWWNPLEDNADAFKLAVELRIPISFPLYTEWDVPEVHAGKYWDATDSLWYPHSENIKDDPLAATRRAIVRAAAGGYKYK
jgi:hypothetical protein